MELRPRSPDLTVCDYFLWGYLKEHVYRTRPATIAELRDKIECSIKEIPQDMVKRACHAAYERFEQCTALQGKQLQM